MSVAAVVLLSVRFPGLGLVSLGAGVSFVSVLLIPKLPSAGRTAILLALVSIVAGAGLGWVLGGPAWDPWSPEVLSVGVWMLSTATLATSVAAAVSGVDRVRQLMLVSMVFALISNAVYFPLDANPWKQALGYPVALLVLVLFRPIRPKGRYIPLLAVAGVSIFFETRSLFLVSVLAAVSLWAARKGFRASRLVKRLALGCSAILVTLVIFLQFGLLGERQRDLYELQAGSTGGIVGGARVEWVITTGLMQLQPLGFGLGAQVPLSVEGLMIDRVRLAGGDFTSPYFSQVVLGDRVDLHSMFANLWFHGTFFGVVFAAFVLFSLVRGLANLSRLPEVWQTFVSFCIWMALWDVLFSPMQQSDRIALGLGLAWALSLGGRQAVQGGHSGNSLDFDRAPFK